MCFDEEGGGGGGGGKCPCYALVLGGKCPTLFSIGGQISTPVNHLGGKCPCIPFFIGGQMSEGGNVLHSSETGVGEVGVNLFGKVKFGNLVFFLWEKV